LPRDQGELVVSLKTAFNCPLYGFVQQERYLQVVSQNNHVELDPHRCISVSDYILSLFIFGLTIYLMAVLSLEIAYV